MSLIGLQFLGLYAVFAIAANWLLRRYYQVWESAGKDTGLHLVSKDPYQIAYLRGGEREAVEVVIFSLLDRGLLEEWNCKLRIARPDARQLVRRPIERAVLDGFRDWCAPQDILGDSAIHASFENLRAELIKGRLLAGPRTYFERSLPLFVALCLTLGLAGWRIAYAWQHGQHNIGFLIVLAVVCTYFLLRAYRQRLTRLGVETLAHLRRLFYYLLLRTRQIAPGGANQEAVAVASVFGMENLPGATFPFIERLFDKQPYDTRYSQGYGGDGGGGGDSGGGDSGGGGCGGGCGGCGGGGCGG